MTTLPILYPRCDPRPKSCPSKRRPVRDVERLVIGFRVCRRRKLESRVVGRGRKVVLESIRRFRAGERERFAERLACAGIQGNCRRERHEVSLRDTDDEVGPRNDPIPAVICGGKFEHVLLWRMPGHSSVYKRS